jgi:hypothetical protein
MQYLLRTHRIFFSWPLDLLLVIAPCSASSRCWTTRSGAEVFRQHAYSFVGPVPVGGDGHGEHFVLAVLGRLDLEETYDLHVFLPVRPQRMDQQEDEVYIDPSKLITRAGVELGWVDLRKGILLDRLLAGSTYRRVSSSSATCSATTASDVSPRCPACSPPTCPSPKAGATTTTRVSTATPLPAPTMECCLKLVEDSGGGRWVTGWAVAMLQCTRPNVFPFGGPPWQTKLATPLVEEPDVSSVDACSTTKED